MPIFTIDFTIHMPCCHGQHHRHHGSYVLVLCSCLHVPIYMLKPLADASGPKVVSKAFQVLSDANLRAAFDSHGGDPESRASGMPSFRSASGDGGMRFENEVSPEELFNMFFGGGFPRSGGQFGGQFGGANGTFLSHAALPACALPHLPTLALPQCLLRSTLTSFGLNSIHIRYQRLPACRFWRRPPPTGSS
jgi:hypothetical protein